MRHPQGVTSGGGGVSPSRQHKSSPLERLKGAGDRIAKSGQIIAKSGQKLTEKITSSRKEQIAAAASSSSSAPNFPASSSSSSSSFQHPPSEDEPLPDRLQGPESDWVHINIAPVPSPPVEISANHGASRDWMVIFDVYREEYSHQIRSLQQAARADGSTAMKNALKGFQRNQALCEEMAAARDRQDGPHAEMFRVHAEVMEKEEEEELGCDGKVGRRGGGGGEKRGGEEEEENEYVAMDDDGVDGGDDDDDDDDDGCGGGGGPRRRRRRRRR
eukprot:763815-Hanusia_phi.AAC.3